MGRGGVVQNRTKLQRTECDLYIAILVSEMRAQRRQSWTAIPVTQAEYATKQQGQCYKAYWTVERIGFVDG
jgi:hypothetical protein